ncbi:unnamed protein product [Urochloa decumbens]|uniref:Uncharacterized protein n=1 Tax=Urochloa decumbens TaxID=240449 RepID=A0ABC8YFX6_9POAL
MMTVAADCPSCNFNHCFCRWRRLCSPEIPRVGSGVGDYTFLPDDDDLRSSSTLSVVLGVVSKFHDDSSLRLHRFRVARSGRVLGRNGDSLEVLADDVDYKPKNTWSHVRASNATRSPDAGRSLSLCLFSREHHLSDLTKAQCPRPVQLHLDLADGDATRVTVSVSPLPGLNLGPLMPTCPISAAGELWAPHLTELDGPCSLVMRRLGLDNNKDGLGRWVEVAGLRLPRGRERVSWRDGNNVHAFQGFAVVGSTILLSLFPHLFFTFDCSTHAWAPVAISKDHRTRYVPLQQSSVYVEEDGAIYSLCGGSMYAYKLCWNDQDRHRHRMAPPAMVGDVCPFVKEGSGFLVHLGGRVMCSVWIGENLRCSCHAKLVLITSFRVVGDSLDGDFTHKEVEFLQSTCRRLDLWPASQHSDRSYFEFRFLQEYEEFNRDNARPATVEKNTGNAMAASMHVEAMAIPASSNVVESPRMLACCREFMDKSPFSDAVMLECSDVQTSKALYIICQVASYSAVYKIKTLNGKLISCHDKILAPHCIMDNMYDHDGYRRNQPLPWHFICGSEYIYAVPYRRNEISACNLHQGTLHHFPARKPIGDEFSIALVLRVGHKTIAIGDSLQGVYQLSHANEWTHLGTHGLPDLERKVNLSGYVVLSEESFMVSDVDTNRCFLLNLQVNRWSIVMPFLELIRSLECGRELRPSCLAGRAFLSERAVLVKGFIYTCSLGGLAAYEMIVEQDGSYYLGDRIDLHFRCSKSWERHRMCFDYVGEDAHSGTIMFFVLQGDDYVRQPGYSNNCHPICITAVQVKTEGLRNGKLKPKTIGLVDIGRSFIECDDVWDNHAIWTRSCFAAASF